MPNIEELLRQAIADGKFDHLPGKGKPIHLDDPNPHADPDWELAYRMLKDAGYTLPWIESLREIDAELESARQELRTVWEHDQQNYAHSHQLPKTNWEHTQLAFKMKLDELNKRIRTVNQQVPSSRFQRPLLKYSDEIKYITGEQ